MFRLGKIEFYAKFPADSLLFSLPFLVAAWNMLEICMCETVFSEIKFLKLNLNIKHRLLEIWIWSGAKRAPKIDHINIKWMLGICLTTINAFLVACLLCYFLFLLWHIEQFKNRMIHNKSYIMIPFFCFAQSWNWIKTTCNKDFKDFQVFFSFFFGLDSLNAWIFRRAHALCPISSTFHSKWKIPKIFAMTSSALYKRRMNTAEHCRWLGTKQANGSTFGAFRGIFPKHSHTHTRTWRWKICADIWKRDEPMCSTSTLRTWIAYSQTTILSGCCDCYLMSFIYIFFVRSLAFFVHSKRFGLHISRLLRLFCLELWAHSHSESGVLWAVQLCVVVALTFRSKSENPIKWI